MSDKQAAASDCLSIWDESFDAAETGVNKMMEATRPASGAGEGRRVEQWQGKCVGCGEVRSKGTICRLRCNNHQYRAGNISAAHQMADGMVFTGGVGLVVVTGRHVVMRGKLRLCG